MSPTMQSERIGDRDFGPVERRGGCWGWFLTVDRCQPRFVAPGYIKTKTVAVAHRLADIAKQRKAQV